MVALAFGPFKIIAMIGTIMIVFFWCLKDDTGMFALLKSFVIGSLVMALYGLSGDAIATIWIVLFCLFVLSSIVYSE